MNHEPVEFRAGSRECPSDASDCRRDSDIQARSTARSATGWIQLGRDLSRFLSISAFELMKQVSYPGYSGLVESLASNSGGDVDREHQSQ